MIQYRYKKTPDADWVGWIELKSFNIFHQSVTALFKAGNGPINGNGKKIKKMRFVWGESIYDYREVN